MNHSPILTWKGFSLKLYTHCTRVGGDKWKTYKSFAPSSSQITTISLPALLCFTSWIPFLHPTNSIWALKVWCVCYYTYRQLMTKWRRRSTKLCCMQKTTQNQVQKSYTPMFILSHHPASRSEVAIRLLSTMPSDLSGGLVPSAPRNPSANICRFTGVWTVCVEHTFHRDSAPKCVSV